MIHKVATGWVPLRNSAGKIISAKVEDKAGVDYLGVWHQGAIAFDAKSTINTTRWPLHNLCPEQFEFLRDYRAVNPHASAFILLGFLRLDLCFLLTMDLIESRWNEWKKGGQASFSVKELSEKAPSLRLDYPLDYLSVLAQARA